jgi:hypothetical protein
VLQNSAKVEYFVLPDFRIIYEARSEIKLVLLMLWKPTTKSEAMI